MRTIQTKVKRYITKLIRLVVPYWEILVYHKIDSVDAYNECYAYHVGHAKAFFHIACILSPNVSIFLIYE